MPDHTLRIKTLGGLSIERNGEVIGDFASRKAEALLVYLACNPRAHPREVLAELLWDDRTQRQSMANLRVVLASLRKEVGDYVEITRTTASIASRPTLSLDVAELEAATGRLREQGGTLSQELAERVTNAAAHYQGYFLEGVFPPDASGFEAWAVRERMRLQRLVVEVLVALGRWRLLQGDAAGAIVSATRLLEIDPFTEAGHRQLMEALARAGQRGEALAQFERCRELLAEELGVEPEAETRALYEAIKSQTLVVPEPTGAAVEGSLPLEPTPFLGRDAELVALESFIADPTVPLVTIMGPGGIGKTRLALEVAQKQAARFEDGAAFSSLAPLSAPDAIVPAVAQAVGFRFHSGDNREPKEQLLGHLRGKKLLLVLDNLEHLAEGAPLLTEIVRAAPAVKLLVTSRERLKLQVEQVYPLQGLALAQWETLEEATTDALVQLFLYHARRVRPSFSLRQEHLQPLQDIFRLVGGIPLAVILAAGWVEVLSPAQIATEIGRNLELLETTTRDVAQRHQSMRAVFEGTWARLSDGERRTYAALSIFRGGFTLEAAREVAGASPRDLIRLLERSLLTRFEGGRFQQHELLRQFAAQELARNPQEESSFRSRHSAFYCRLMAAREPDLKGPRALEAEAEIELEYENVRVAWMWAVDNVQETSLRQAAAGLSVYCFRRRMAARDETALFRQACEKVSAVPGVALRTRGMLLSWKSFLLTQPPSSDRSEVEQLGRQALSYLDQVAQEGEDIRADRAIALLSLAFIAGYRNNAAMMEESLALYSDLGMQWEMAVVHFLLTGPYFGLGEYARVDEHLLQAEQLFEMVGDKAYSHQVKTHLGYNKVVRGQLDQGQTAIREALAWFQENGPAHELAYTWVRLGETQIYFGQFDQALLALATARPTPEHWLYYMRDMLAIWARMHLASYEQVQQESQTFLVASRQRRDQILIGCGKLMLGLTALAMKRVDTARSYLHESVAVFYAAEQNEELSWARAGLAYLALHEGDATAARNQLAEVLQASAQNHLFLAALHALPAAALFMAEFGDKERAVELYALASSYGFVCNSQWFEDVAGQRIAAVVETLAEEEVSTARAWGEARDLWESLEDLLQELKGMDL